MIFVSTFKVEFGFLVWVILLAAAVMMKDCMNQHFKIASSLNLWGRSVGRSVGRSTVNVSNNKP